MSGTPSDAKGPSAKSYKSGSSLSAVGCALVLATAFLGWMCAGWQLAISSLAMRDAPADLLREDFIAQGIAAGLTADIKSDNVTPSASVIAELDKDRDGMLSLDEKKNGREGVIGSWFGSLIAAFLLGAALGGYVFGWFGDRFGRAKAMAISIMWYSAFSAITVFVQDPWQLWAVRFVACMGIGGMWPNGIALVSEAWPNISRPILAGAIGTAANVGILMLSAIANVKHVTIDDWHWIMWLGAAPFLLGLFVWFFVPESPRWLHLRSGAEDSKQPAPGLVEIFRPPILWLTILGIGLGTIPLFGGWGSSNWAIAWASSFDDAGLKARVMLARSLPGTISSLLGGGLAMMIGRRPCYFILSLGALVSAQVLFHSLHPVEDEFWFLFWFGSLGFFSGFFFGWLPLCLPELFPTRVRSTGAGVSFNWGRILTAAGVLFAGGMLKQYFNSDYAEIGKWTSLIYAFGLIIVFFVPDTKQRALDD